MLSLPINMVYLLIEESQASQLIIASGDFVRDKVTSAALQIHLLPVEPTSLLQTRAMNIPGLGWGLPDWLLLTLLFFFMTHKWLTRNHDHFSKRRLPFIPPVSVFGGMLPVLTRQLSMADLNLNIYNDLKGYKMGGLFEFINPVTVIRDPEIIKLITVKSFDHFIDHRGQIDTSLDPLIGKNLFALKGQHWRDMRATLSPSFTSSKMKAMFALISDCGEQLVQHLVGQTKKQDETTLQVEMKDLFTRYTNDVIATSAFGVTCDSLKNPDNEFYKMGKDVTNFGGVRTLKLFGLMSFPSVMKFFKISFVSAPVKKFFRGIIRDTIATRERENIVRPDLVHLLMQARKEEQSVNGARSNKTKLFQDDDDITAQAFIFFIAGFEPSSTLLCFTTHQLALHPEVQERLLEEIDSTLRDNDNKVTYEVIQGMKYLDMVVSETLRKYPPAVLMDRKCVKPYRIPATETNPEFNFKVGDEVWIPTYGIHHDPQYYPDPEKFDPERFSDENKNNINPYTYLPFGIGPRSCIGNRFALMEAKIGIVHLMTRFTFKEIPKTPNPIVFSKKGFNMTAEGGFWLGLELREHH